MLTVVSTVVYQSSTPASFAIRPTSTVRSRKFSSSIYISHVNTNQRLYETWIEKVVTVMKKEVDVFVTMVNECNFVPWSVKINLAYKCKIMSVWFVGAHTVWLKATNFAQHVKFTGLYGNPYFVFLHFCIGPFLPARRYASVGNCDRNVSVCLSVCLTRAGIVSKRRKLAAWFLHHLVAPWLWFSDAKFHHQILRGSPERGPQTRVGRKNSAIF